MSHITASENWLFEIKEVRAIKTDAYGKPYSAIADITIVDGDVHVEGLLSKHKNGGRRDLKEIENYIKKLGFKEYFYTRYKNGLKIKKKKKLVEC